MNDSKTKDLTMVPNLSFNRRIDFLLYAQDARWFDDENFLGSWVILFGELNQGMQEVRFNGDGADYTITYEVLP